MRISAPSPLVPALAFGVAAMVAAGAVALFAAGNDWGVLVLPAALSGAGVGALIWGPLLRRPRPVGPLGGAVAGAAVALLTHPPTLLLALLAGHAAGLRDSLGQPVMTPTEALAALPLYTLVSWVVAGWLTAAVGAAVGVAVARWARRGAPTLPPQVVTD